MAQLRPIAQLGNAILRATAQAIPANAIPTLTLLAEDMLETLAASNGVGLAAPQVRESIQMIIVASRPTLRYPKAPTMPATVMINPKYTTLSNAMEKDWEGCLSIPGIRALVPRHQDIGITYTDPTGVVQNLELHGFVARVFQHEIDHLEGLVYLDRVEHNRDIISEAEFFKL